MLNEIKLLLSAQDNPIAFLATRDADGHPRVRPVSLMTTPRGFYIGTSRQSRKAEEIGHHECVEWVTLLPGDGTTGYLRFSGNAIEVEGEEKINAVQENDYPVDKYWSGGINDPDFVVYRIKPGRVEYIRPGENNALDVTQIFLDQEAC